MMRNLALLAILILAAGTSGLAQDYDAPAAAPTAEPAPSLDRQWEAPEQPAMRDQEDAVSEGEACPAPAEAGRRPFPGVGFAFLPILSACVLSVWLLVFPIITLVVVLKINERVKKIETRLRPPGAPPA